MLPTYVISKVLILNIFEANHVSKHNDATRLPEAFLIFTSLRVFIAVDDLPYLRAGTNVLPVILRFAFAFTTRHLLYGERVYNPTAIGAKPLTLFMPPFSHEASSEALRVRSAETHENERTTSY